MFLFVILVNAFMFPVSIFTFPVFSFAVLFPVFALTVTLFVMFATFDWLIVVLVVVFAFTVFVESEPFPVIWALAEFSPQQMLSATFVLMFSLFILVSELTDP